MLVLSVYLSLGVPNGLFPSDLPTKTLCASRLFPICVPHSIYEVVHVMCRFARFFITCSFLRTNIFLSALRICSSLNVTDQVSHP